MAGFVYIISNPLFTRIKIGKSTKDPTGDRLDELNRETGTPEKYKCEYYAFVGDEHGLELAMHRQFSDRRPNAQREFFEVGISEVITAIRNTAPNFGGIKYEEIYYQDLKKIEYKSGQVYFGEIKKNLRNGHGTQTWPSGQKYVGNFENGQQNGHGTQTWPSGQKYVGAFVAGKRHGHGTLTWPDGQIYVGEYANDSMHGQGTLTKSVKTLSLLLRIVSDRGDKYVGTWRFGKKHGKFTVITPSGSKSRPTYKDDKISSLWHKIF